MKGLIQKFQEDGFVVIEEFLSDEEVSELWKAGCELAENIPQDCRKTIFSTTQTSQSKENYFLESGDKISYFFEAGAVGQDGQLTVASEMSLNKVGHALHWLHPAFRKVSFSNKVKEACYQLSLENPVLLQSMYIYKNPSIGSEVVPHQDATFLSTEPMSLVGFWIALEDAILDNGCLWFIPGSHTAGVHRRYMRNPDKSSSELLIYDVPPPLYPDSNFQPVPVKKGSCVLIHGQVVHKSSHNKSTRSRHAYTFHVMDASSQYSLDNWLQSERGFPLLYTNN